MNWKSQSQFSATLYLILGFVKQNMIQATKNHFETGQSQNGKTADFALPYP